MAWVATVTADLEPVTGSRVFGYAQWRQDWVKVSSEPEQDRRAWSASIRDVVNSIGDAGSTWIKTKREGVKSRRFER